MAESLRFHLDEHVPKAVATGLRSHGIDVTTAADAGLLSAKDQEHLDFAASQLRVLVTHDKHCLRHAASGVVHTGIGETNGSGLFGSFFWGCDMRHACQDDSEESKQPRPWRDWISTWAHGR